MWPRNQFQALFNFQRILCKKESEEVCMLIWTNSNSFANKQLASKISFYNRGCASFVANTKELGISFQVAVVIEFFDKIFSFVI